MNKNFQQSPSKSEDGQFQQIQQLNFQQYDDQLQQTITKKHNNLWSKQIATQLLKQTLKKTCTNLQTLKTNIVYNFKNSSLDIFSKRQKLIIDQQSPISLLGKIYKNLKQKQIFYKDYIEIIWFTYRSNIYGIQSDAGWGCMIRVCQMVLAQTLKRLKPSNKPKQIVNYFKDTPQAYFSLTRICQKGNINQRWTSSIQIFTLLKKLIKDFNQQIKLSIDIYSMAIEINNIKNGLKQQSYPKLIFISNRLGKKNINQQYHNHLLQLMNIQYFVGIIGGNGGQALYLIGHDNQKIIFLDPHYVQPNNESKNQYEQLSKYFSSQPYLINLNKLASSVAFNYLVKSQEEHIKLLKLLYWLQKKYNNQCLCLEIISQQLQENYLEQKNKRKQKRIYQQQEDQDQIFQQL